MLQDMEPEYIAVTENGRTAYVALQVCGEWESRARVITITNLQMPDASRVGEFFGSPSVIP